MSSTQSQNFQNLLKALVFYTILVILWGAWVRISHSGNGCGDTWPLCRGQLIPEAEQRKTWVEYAHRLMSGFYGIFVVGLFIRGRKIFPAKHPARRAGLWTLIFMITEALLGAKLVLFKLVDSNDSFFRLFAMSLHQVNSLLLMGSTVVWVLWSKPQNHSVHLISKSAPFNPKYFVGFIVVAVAGAWAALASTLYPSLSLSQGLSEDLNLGSHYLLKIRILHPLLALSFGTFFALYFWKKSDATSDLKIKKLALQNSAAFALAMLFGILTLLLLAPVWMKLAHLAIAHLLWIAMINYAVTSLEASNR